MDGTEGCKGWDGRTVGDVKVGNFESGLPARGWRAGTAGIIWTVQYADPTDLLL